MSACSDVKRWVTEEVQGPLEENVTEARRQCETVKQRIEDTVSKPIESWVAREERKCKEKKCKWWCGCCNKWFCWIETFVVGRLEKRFVKRATNKGGTIFSVCDYLSREAARSRRGPTH